MTFLFSEISQLFYDPENIVKLYLCTDGGAAANCAVTLQTDIRIGVKTP